MQYKTILLEKRDGIAIITLNRPDKLNAINVVLRSEFFEALDGLELDDDVRVVIVTGAGRAFCAGADIAEFETDPGKMRQGLIQMIKREPLRILSFEKPIIGAVNGIASGDGAQWLLQFDLMVASERARFAWPATSLGILCPYGIIRLASEVGRFRAKEALMTCKYLTAEEAYQWGLVTKVVPHEQLMDAAIELADKIKKMPPLSIRSIKEAVNRGLEGYEYAYQTMMNLTLTEDFQEGIRAFLEKREPEFRGR
jgi:enoyl-CoA hydratase